MEKTYRFNLIPGVEFIEKDGFCFAMADDKDCMNIAKVTIEGLKQYENNIQRKNEQLVEYKKKLKNAKCECSYLNGQVEYIKKCADNEIDHRNKLLDGKDEEIKRLFKKLREETETHKEYIKTFTDKINALEATLKKKDETIEKLRNTAEFANNICDGYGALTSTLMSSIEEKNSEIKVLSDQVTRLMDQLKEVMGENAGCSDIKPCRLTPEMIAEYERRTETEGKPETNSSKALRNLVISALDTWLSENAKED